MAHHEISIEDFVTELLCVTSIGTVQAALIIETIMEHVAKSLNKHPILVKELNLYHKGQVSEQMRTFKHFIGSCMLLSRLRSVNK